MFVEAILDPERKGASFQGLAERVAFFVTGVGFALMAYATVNLLLGTEGNGTMGLDDLANILLTPRLGRWSVGLVGAIVMTAGLLQIRLGISAGFGHILQTKLSRLERLAVTTSGVVGLWPWGSCRSWSATRWSRLPCSTIRRGPEGGTMR